MLDLVLPYCIPLPVLWASMFMLTQGEPEIARLTLLAWAVLTLAVVVVEKIVLSH